MAFEYSLILPRPERAPSVLSLAAPVRAADALAVLAHNPAVFEPALVKIDRETVMRIMVLTRESVADDRALESSTPSARGGSRGAGHDRSPEPCHALRGRSGLEVLAATQDADGSWKGDYGGPLFLVPVYVWAWSCSDDRPIRPRARDSSPTWAPEPRRRLGAGRRVAQPCLLPRCWST